MPPTLIICPSPRNKTFTHPFIISTPPAPHNNIYPPHPHPPPFPSPCTSLSPCTAPLFPLPLALISPPHTHIYPPSPCTYFSPSHPPPPPLPLHFPLHSSPLFPLPLALTSPPHTHIYPPPLPPISPSSPLFPLPLALQEEGGASLSPDGTKFIAGGSDLWLREFDVRSGEVLQTFKGHHGPIRCVRYHPSGKPPISY